MLVPDQDYGTRYHGTGRTDIVAKYYDVYAYTDDATSTATDTHYYSYPVYESAHVWVDPGRVKQPNYVELILYKEPDYVDYVAPYYRIVPKRYNRIRGPPSIPYTL